MGAGAILWGAVAQVALSAPSLSNSMTAETLGVRAGIALAQLVTEFPGPIEVVGDNLPVLRMAVGNGRVRAPEAWQALEAPLLHVATQGWQCKWTAVKRIFNVAADQVATNGTEHAVNCAVANDLAPSLRLRTSRPSGIETRLPWHEGWIQNTVANPFWSPKCQ